MLSHGLFQSLLKISLYVGIDRQDQIIAVFRLRDALHLVVHILAVGVDSCKYPAGETGKVSLII